MRKLRSPQRPLASSWSVLSTCCWRSSFSPPRPPGSNFRGCWSCALQRRGRIARCRWSECFYRVTASDHVWTKAAACKLPLFLVGRYPPLRNFFPSYSPWSSPTFISFLNSNSCVCFTGLRWSLGQEDVQKEPPAQPEGLVWRHSSGGKPIDPRF